MILRLRHVVPWLQKFGGWSASTIPPPLVRRFSGISWTTGNLAPSAIEGENQPENGSTIPSSAAAGPNVEKKRRRSSRRSKAGALAEAEKPALSVLETGEMEYSSDITEDGEVTAARSPSKKRTPSRPTAATSGGELAELFSNPSVAEAEAALKPKRTRRKKHEEREEEILPPINPLAGDDIKARCSSGADASSSGGDTTRGVAGTRASSITAKKAATAVKASKDEEETKNDERVSIQSLPFEDFLVLPRKAEHILIALGLRVPHDGSNSSEGETQASYPVAPAISRSGSIGSVLELASYLGRPDPKEIATPLLIAQYQGYLGPSPDYLYDLFHLDYDPPFLPSDVVRNAAVGAARTVSRASSLLSAKGAPPETLAQASMEHLQDAVGPAAVAAQEARGRGLTEAQLELFLLDWASARLAGLKGPGGISYLARRCAALQLTRRIVIERLYRYAVEGQSMEELASAGGKTVRISQPMDALLEGLKAGVRLDAERLLLDFRLTSPGAPLGEHLEGVRRAMVHEAARSLEPGSALYYNTLVEKLYVHPEIKTALKQQEAQWQKEQGLQRDGSVLTHLQMRLLFHLWRLERFHAEEQARRSRRAAEAAPPVNAS